MNDSMNPLVQFSPQAGHIVLETVPGLTNTKLEQENDVHAADGADRSMYCYAPQSGCPDPKQTQVVMVLRNGTDAASAEECMKRLGLDTLAEEEHFLLLFPNPQMGGWNYAQDPARDNDMDYLVRCFGVLRGSKLGVNGFNGMIFYIADSPEASAMLTTLAALRPLNVPAMMVSHLPEEYTLPANALHVETAAWSSDPRVTDYLIQANGVSSTEPEHDGITVHLGTNPECRLITTARPTDADSVRLAWEYLFSRSRRWQNDVYGHYQHRIAFTERGVVAHVSDKSLGVNDNYPHTWYEYIPPQLRNSTEKVPLVFYFHGVNCVPLYGAEQSNWMDVADRENLIVVFPAPARSKCWNIFDLPVLPSDMDFALALVEHMNQVHPIDKSRIYVSGFSMGGAMTHALASTYPEIFAAAAPCNAFATFFMDADPAKMLQGFIRDVPPEKLGHVCISAERAKEKKAKRDLLMPVIQNAGAVDNLMMSWPVPTDSEGMAAKSLAWWKNFDHIPQEPMFDENSETGLAADETIHKGNGRYTVQSWYNKAVSPDVPLLKLTVAANMPHAIDPVQIEWGWEFMRHFSRGKDGELIVTK